MIDNPTNKFIVLAYEEDSPEFICLGTYATQIQATSVAKDTKHLFHNKQVIIAKILKEMPNV